MGLPRLAERLLEERGNEQKGVGIPSLVSLLDEPA